MADKDTIRNLRNQIDDLSSQIDDLEWSLDETREQLEFGKDQAEELFKIYKRDLERQGLWNDELERHLELFFKFDLGPALDSVQ